MRIAAFAGLAGILLLAACERPPVEKGRVCLALGDFPRAIAFFETALERDPDDPQARLGLGKALLQKAVARRGDSTVWNDALLNLEAFRALAPSRDIRGLLCETYTEHARFLLSSGDTLSALRSLTRAREHDAEDLAAINLAGIIYCRLGQPEKGEALFRSALALDGGNASANFNLGMLSWQRQDYAAARDYWFKALENAPQDEDVLYWFALSEKHLQNIP